MRIYIDFDDVLCETARHLAGMAHELFGRGVPYEAIEGFNLQEAFDLSDEEIVTLMRRAHCAEVLAGLAPAPGSLEALAALAACGHELMIVTGRPAASHEGSSRWLARHGLVDLPILHVDKYGRDLKRMAACHGDCCPETLNPDALTGFAFDAAIEDAPAALDLLAPWQECRVIVYDRPWNRGYALGDNMRRATSWGEIVEMLRG